LKKRRGEDPFFNHQTRKKKCEKKVAKVNESWGEGENNLRGREAKTNLWMKGGSEPSWKRKRKEISGKTAYEGPAYACVGKGGRRNPSTEGGISQHHFYQTESSKNKERTIVDAPPKFAVWRNRRGKMQRERTETRPWVCKRERDSHRRE